MTQDYPERPIAPAVVRYACMIFGLATVIGGIGQATRKDLFAPVAGLLVGGVWFAFGKYGGLPLVNTVADWHPSAPGALEDMHRRGLLVMRARRWTLWAAIPGALIVTAFLVPSLLERGHPELVALVLGVSLGYINFRYYLSRCPRCGFGFFTRSTSRAALLRRGNACGHCGLSLDAYKTNHDRQ